MQAWFWDDGFQPLQLRMSRSELLLPLLLWPLLLQRLLWWRLLLLLHPGHRETEDQLQELQ